MKSLTLEKYRKSFPFLAFAGIAAVLFFAAPQNYSLAFSAVCLGFFVLIFAACLVLIKENSIFNFVSLFSCAYCLVYFIYPVFVLPVNKTRWFMFYYEFSETTVCKTTALALLGYACFMVGYAVRCTNRLPKPQKKPPLCQGSIAPDSRILLLLLVLTLLECYKIFVLGFTNYGSEKASVSGIWEYVKVLQHGAFMAGITVVFYRFYHSEATFLQFLQKNMFFFLLFGVYVVTILISGERAEPLFLVLALIAGVFTYKKPNYLVLGLICVGGVLVLAVIGKVRVEERFTVDLLEIGSDLIINNYTLYYAYEYVAKNGLTVFPLFAGLLRTVPLLLGLVRRLFHLPESLTSSAMLFTTNILGNYDTLGLGTNIVASIYLSLGVPGVIVLMFLLGYAVEKINRADTVDRCFRLGIGFELIGVSLYYTRAEYFYPMANITWTMAFITLFCILSRDMSAGDWGAVLLEKAECYRQRIAGSRPGRDGQKHE